MRFPLFERRKVWWPTRLGWVILAVILGGSALLWWFEGEAFLSETRRLPAKILVVEGWIGLEGIRAAREEFEQGGYDFLVTTGGLTGERWMEQRWSYAEMAEKELIRQGIARDRIINAPAPDTDSQRTYASAAAVWHALQAKGREPDAVNILTLGVHARRSRMIFEKARGAEAEVGVISWAPPDYARQRWWRSSERAENLIKETAGFVFEALFNSGRGAAGSK